jgi:hypothetical protein
MARKVNDREIGSTKWSPWQIAQAFQTKKTKTKQTTNQMSSSTLQHGSTIDPYRGRKADQVSLFTRGPLTEAIPTSAWTNEKVCCNTFSFFPPHTATAERIQFIPANTISTIHTGGGAETGNETE